MLCKMKPILQIENFQDQTIQICFCYNIYYQCYNGAKSIYIQINCSSWPVSGSDTNQVPVIYHRQKYKIGHSTCLLFINTLTLDIDGTIYLEDFNQKSLRTHIYNKFLLQHPCEIYEQCSGNLLMQWHNHFRCAKKYRHMSAEPQPMINQTCKSRHESLTRILQIEIYQHWIYNIIYHYLRIIHSCNC